VSGLRTGKIVTKDGTTTEYNYVYENGLLLQMTRGSRVYDFSYDANGTPVSIAYRTRATATPSYYYYGTNWRGDVVALYSSSGLITALYEYDAYGNVTVKSSNGQVNTSETHIANINPLRYRGYVYDNETGFYYLQSRYYDPTTCRFVNEDIYYDTGVGLTGLNMFAYCNNNPVVNLDPSGTKIFACCPYGCEYCKNDKIKDTSSNSIFGAGATNVIQNKHEDEMVLYPFSEVFTVKSGTSTTVTGSSYGDSSKLFSVYAQGRGDNLLLSSAGVKVNVNKSTFTWSLGLDNMGLSYTNRTDDFGYSYGFVVDFTQLKIGYENATIAWHDDVMVREYTNYSFTANGIFMIYALLTSGQYVPQSGPQPHPQPSLMGGR